MSDWWKGKFSKKDETANEKHQTARNEAERDQNPLPDQVTYGVPPEAANKIRDAKRRLRVVGQRGTTTLAQPVLASVVYMDVGCWIGGAPDDHDAPGRWGKKRHFGVVYGRLSMLCEYRPWEHKGETDVVPGKTWNPFDLKNPEKLAEYRKVLPLLQTLSTNPNLGPVVIRKLMLNDRPEAAVPPEDRIHVILGDLHAPVMTEHERTHDGATQSFTPDFPGTLHTLPGAHLQAAQQLGVIRLGPTVKYPLHGRYDRGLVAPLLVPALARLFGEGAKVVVNADQPTFITIVAAAVPLTGAELAMPLFIPTPGRVVFGVTGVALGSIAAATSLRSWRDELVKAPVVDDWFDRYHGLPHEVGADVFDGAGEDLLAWLKMLVGYQRTAGPMDKGADKPPVRLMQLGDLFDFWIGLQCPFDLTGGARVFPDEASATQFLNYWLKESLRTPAIEYLWNFDSHCPPRSAALGTVLLHGNHDTYMGTRLLRGRAPLASQFVEPSMGLIAQHGHQDDLFNNEPTAGIGYLLTQAVFIDNYVRTIEDPMSSLKTKLFGGMWTRLGYNEAALKNCVFQRLDQGSALASSFIMGHTHEPALQRVDVVEKIPTKPQVSAPPPYLLIPPPQQCSPGAGVDARVTVVFRQIHVLDHNGDEPWNLRAFIGAVQGKNGTDVVTVLDEVTIDKGASAPANGRAISLSLKPDDRMELTIQGWQGRHRSGAQDPFSLYMEEFWNYVGGKISDLTPDFLKAKHEWDVISVRVWPNTWDGTRTLESENLRVTFSIDWQ